MKADDNYKFLKHGLVVNSFYFQDRIQIQVVAISIFQLFSVARSVNSFSQSISTSFSLISSQFVLINVK